MFNWLPIIIFIGFIAGFGAGHEYVEKEKRKITPIIKFVYNEDKLETLSDLGITIDEHTKCHTCADMITLENLGLVIQSSSGPIFICSKKNCLITSDMIKLQREQ